MGGGGQQVNSAEIIEFFFFNFIFFVFVTFINIFIKKSSSYLFYGYKIRRCWIFDDRGVQSGQD